MTDGSESHGLEPGLKSVASASSPPASISARAGGIGRPSVSAAVGSATPTTSDAASLATPSGPVASRWSTERAASSIARSIAPISANWSPCRRSARPVLARGLEVAPRLVGVERAALAEDVGRLGERPLGDLREDLVDAELDVGVGVRALGHGVRRQAGAHDVGGRVVAGLLGRAQHHRLGLGVEAVARLDLDRGGAVLEHAGEDAGACW